MPAHPRSRGENSRRIARPASGRGSSPLTRGKCFEALERRNQDGLIPAHAGKTRDLLPVFEDAGAHPRSRGENAAGIASIALTQGSSPLTRGKLGDREPAR